MDEAWSTSDEILQAVRAIEPLIEFREAATESSLAAIERRLGARLPGELRSFLLASNGASQGLRLDSGELLLNVTQLVWSAEEIEQELDCDPILERPPGIFFFANAGVDGILFGHPIRPGSGIGPDVVWWDPIPNRLNPAGPTFRAWLEAWLTGALTV